MKQALLFINQECNLLASLALNEGNRRQEKKQGKNQKFMPCYKFYFLFET